MEDILSKIVSGDNSWTYIDELKFRDWYTKWAKKLKLNQDPYDPSHYYDYRSAYREGANPKAAWEDIEIREPSQTEINYFKKNTNIPGMSSEDGKVVLNPFSNLSNEEMNSVITNERARSYMRYGGPRPDFDLTPKQLQDFKLYSKDEQDIKETIAARYLSGDPSGGELTDKQIEWVHQNLFPHWPSEFKVEGHPNLIVDGVNTKTGVRVR